MKLKRLNHDSSWHVWLGGCSFIVDPWLVGSEIDGFKWLNEQWHVVPPVPIEDLAPYDFIVVTQPYEDHCHLETLKLMDTSKPILATKKAYSKIRKKLPNRTLHLIPDGAEPLDWDGLKFSGFRPKKLIDPIYFSIGIEGHDGSIFYAPHGFTLGSEQMQYAPADTTLLITTFTDFRLPAILGGHVNPGIENAALLHTQLKPEFVINTHDEPKKMKGLVARHANVTYPDYDALEADETFNFIRTDNYEIIDLSPVK